MFRLLWVENEFQFSIPMKWQFLEMLTKTFDASEMQFYKVFKIFLKK